MRRLVLALCLMLSACQSGPQVVVDKHMGTRIATSGVYNAYTGAFDFLQVRTFKGSKSGYGIDTLYSNYGWIFIAQAFSFGKALPYSSTGNDAGMCAGAGGCITMEKGRILLTEEQFRSAAKAGFEFELVGSQGKVVGKVPSKAFQEVLKLN